MGLHHNYTMYCIACCSKYVPAPPCCARLITIYVNIYTVQVAIYSTNVSSSYNPLPRAAGKIQYDAETE